MVRPAYITAITHDTAIFPWRDRTPYAGLPTVATIALILVIGHATGHGSAGAIAAGAALTVGFASFHATLASTLLTMTLLTLGMASGTLAGSLGAQHTWIVMLLALVAAVNFGLLSGLSDTAGFIGQQCAVFVVINSYFQYGVHYAVGRASMVLLGGSLVIALNAVTEAFQHRHTPSSARPPAPLHVRLETRLRELWDALGQQLHPSGATASYTVRLALTLLITTAIYRHYQIRNGYWLPMTAVLVLKPQWTGTLSRGIARLVGTLAGVAIALGLALVLPQLPENLWVVFALILVAPGAATRSSTSTTRHSRCASHW